MSTAKIQSRPSLFRQHHHTPSERAAYEIGLPWTVAQPALVAYRSAGIGVFGAFMRFAGMPLEKIALFMNSSQVSGKGQFQQAIRLTFAEGALAPYRVVGPSSLTAWFMQYSVMGVAFQLVDQTLSTMLKVQPVYYGHQLMQPPEVTNPAEETMSYRARFAAKTLISPILAGGFESFVANRAEVQRYFGPTKFVEIETRMNASTLVRMAGPAFAPNVARNVIMCQTSFLLTPITYKLYFPQEMKSKSTLFWYGLGCNMFVGNLVAITQQAAWGRSLDYLATHGRISYSAVWKEGIAKDGLAAFFTVPKWSSRILMNAPAQGTLPWFYNEVLPLAEPLLLRATKDWVYDIFLADDREPVSAIPAIPQRISTLQRQRSRIGTLPTANPDFLDEEEEDEGYGDGKTYGYVQIPPSHRRLTSEDTSHSR